MKQDEYAQKRARAERLYAWFLRLYPGAHRRTFGQHLSRCTYRYTTIVTVSFFASDLFTKLGN
jgi:hypothetical protein